MKLETVPGELIPVIIIGETSHESVINPFVPNAPFLYPLKASENSKIS